MATHNKPVGPSGRNPTPGSDGFDGASTPQENLDKIKNRDPLQQDRTQQDRTQQTPTPPSR